MVQEESCDRPSSSNIRFRVVPPPPLVLPPEKATLELGQDSSIEVGEDEDESRRLYPRSHLAHPAWLKDRSGSPTGDLGFSLFSPSSCGDGPARSEVLHVATPCRSLSAENLRQEVRHIGRLAERLRGEQPQAVKASELLQQAANHLDALLQSPSTSALGE